MLFKQFLPLIVFAILGAAIVWLAYRKIDPEGQTKFGDRLKGIRGRIGQVCLLGLVSMILSGGIVQTHKTIQTRRDTILQASASRRPEPNLSGVVQFAPVVAVIEDKTYSRTLTLPPDFATRVGSEGIQVLAPYLQDPSAENVTKLVDSFKRSGQNVEFTRQLTRRDEVPVPADAADIKIGFRDEGAPSGRRHYDAEFVGEYRFKNPRPAEATMRFAFDLPQGGGTVQEFFVEIAGQRITEPNERGLYAWEGQVAPNALVVAHVHYQVTGAAQFDYRLGSERRRIGDFHLVTVSPQAPQFSKSGIYPANMSGSTAEWRLHDVLTAQSISLVFPRADLQAQLLDKTMSILPVALVLFALASFWIAPERALWSSAAFGIALLAIPVLSAYTSPVIATLGGAALSILAGGMVLRGGKGWIIAILAGTSTCIFLTIEHGGLAAWILAAIATFLGVKLISRLKDRNEPVGS